MAEPIALEDHAQAPGTSTTRGGRMLWFVFLLVVANFIWAAQPIAVKYIEPLTPIAIAFIPFLIITPMLIPLLFFGRTTEKLRPGAGDWMKFIIAGVGGQVVCQLFMTWAFAIGLASNCTIIYLLVPVITAAMASIMLGERITVLRVFCLGIGLLGVLLMSAQQVRESSFLQSKYFRGNVLMVVGCVGACFYNVYCKGLMRKFNERDILIYSYITATPVGLIILLWQNPDCFAQLFHMSTRAWFAMAFNALLVYGISMLMFFYVLQFLPVTVALSSVYLLPIFGVLLAMLLLGERLGILTLIGAVIVLVSTVLIMKYDAVDPT